MAREYETVADIVKELRGIKGGQHTNGGLSFERWRARCQFSDDYADRFEAAHQREVAELERKVAELRECLKDAVLDNCAICDSKGKSCEVKGFCLEQRWRKVLETTKGAEDEGK